MKDKIKKLLSFRDKLDGGGAAASAALASALLLVSTGAVPPIGDLPAAFLAEDYDVLLDEIKDLSKDDELSLFIKDIFLHIEGRIDEMNDVVLLENLIMEDDGFSSLYDDIATVCDMLDVYYFLNKG